MSAKAFLVRNANVEEVKTIAKPGALGRVDRQAEPALETSFANAGEVSPGADMKIVLADLVTKPEHDRCRSERLASSARQGRF